MTETAASSTPKYRFRTILISILVAMLSGKVAAQNQMSKGEYENLFMAVFSYMTVIKACDLKNLYRQSDETMMKTIRYGYARRLHSDETERISQNVSFYTAAGIESYRRTAKVSCKQAEEYMRTIIKAIQQLK